MNKLYLLLTTLSLTCASLHGATLMNDAKMLDILVSQKGMTRLSVVGDQIVDVHVFPSVVGNTDMSSLVQLQDSGHVLLYLKDFKRPFQLMLVTRRGRVQDLMLIPSSRPPEPVLLQSPLSKQEQEQQILAQRKTLEEKMKALLKGIVPKDLRTSRPPVGTKSSTFGSLKWTPISFYTDGHHMWSVVTLENVSSEPFLLESSDFLSSPDIESVLFEKSTLLPREKARLILLSRFVSSTSSYERNSL